MSILLEIEEENRAVAEQICIRAKIIKMCEIHDVFLDISDGNYEPAYKLANKLITDKDEVTNSFNGDRIALTDSIKSLMDDIGDTCSFCDNV